MLTRFVFSPMRHKYIRFFCVYALAIFAAPLALAETHPVSSVDELNQAVSALRSGDEIVIAPGEYPLTQTLVIDGGLKGVTVRGESGNRDDVVIIGKGMSNENYGGVAHGFMIRDAHDVTIADLAIRDCYFHNIIIQSEAGAQRPVIRNVRSIDAGEQHLKVTIADNNRHCDGGIVEDSRFEFTTLARHWYTNGIDVLGCADWIVRDCEFINIRSADGRLAGPAILFWRNCVNTLIERNRIMNCDIGISLGNSAGPGDPARDGETVYDHQGGVVRNNFIFRDASISGDTGITVNKCKDFEVYHNTVVLNRTFDWAIDYRFEMSEGIIYNNLSDAPILRRDGANAELKSNLVDAEPSWFDDAASGDLHLSENAAPAIDQSFPMPQARVDIDGEMRGDLPDIGADERIAQSGVPTP